MSKEKSREAPPVPEPLAEPIIDAHTHLDACAAEMTEVLDRANTAGIARVVTVADDLDSARWVTRAAEADERVYAAVALHPTRTAVFGDRERAVLEELAGYPRVVAIGETGLDYYWPSVGGLDHPIADADAQREAFEWHIDLAKRTGKPLMIHDRDAHEDVLEILANRTPPDTVILHCFSGDADIARRATDAGYFLSFSGTVTFRNATALHEAARIAPEHLLLVETDAPFLTPHPYRGRPNEPYCAAYTLRGLAALRGAGEAELAITVRGNAEHAYGLPPL
ncbi:TatD family hydrolase [Sciscionella marina]|uniref:TatD family hydrolase n=1 Tax=Sciscionella marina TaxID=508770 RepID=UPI00036F9ABB|nr:TatD family hydrolase [Sciscionella marina]